MENKLIKSTIKGLEVTYYVVTEYQLENQQRNNILGDIFLLVASLILALAFANTYPEITLLLVLLGTLCLFIAIWFKYINDGIVAKLKKAPEVKYINLQDSDNINIIKATYGSDTQRVDVTDNIKGNIINNKLDMLVMNAEFDGKDPHPGIVKFLEVIYEQDGKVITKKCNEYKRITLP